MLGPVNGERDKITVVLVDDHELYRRGIRSLLDTDPEIAVVGEAADCTEASRVIGEYQPNVAILDVRLPDGTGMDLARVVKELSPPTKAMALSAYEEDGYVLALARLGVYAYLLKTASAVELLAAVRHVAPGGLMFPAAVAGKIMSLLTGTPVTAAPHVTAGLTGREAEGLRNREIADRMGISVRTVESHVDRLLLKLGAKSRTQAVRWAVERGLGAVRTSMTPGAQVERGQVWS